MSKNLKKVPSEEPDKPNKRVVQAIMALEKNGRLTPNAVVEAARNPKSPLHACFVWDDSAAAEKWRQHQARQLIVTVTIKVEYGDRVICTPRFVRDLAAEKLQGYVSQQQLRKEPANARDLLAYELSRAVSVMERTIDLATTLGKREAAAAILRSLERLRKQLLNEREEQAG